MDNSESPVNSTTATTPAPATSTVPGAPAAKGGSTGKIVLIVLGILLLCCCLTGIGLWVASNVLGAGLTAAVNNGNLENYLTDQINNSIEREIEKSGDGETDIDLGGNATVPAGFPADVPQISGGKLILSTSNNVEGSFTLSYRLSGTSANAAYDSYVSAMKSKGWTIESENDFFAKIVTAAKGDRSLSATFTEYGGETSAMVIVDNK